MDTNVGKKKKEGRKTKLLLRLLPYKCCNINVLFLDFFLFNFIQFVCKNLKKYQKCDAKFLN